MSKLPKDQEIIQSLRRQSPESEPSPEFQKKLYKKMQSQSSKNSTAGIFSFFKNWKLLLAGSVPILAGVVAMVVLQSQPGSVLDNTGKINDWQYSHPKNVYESRTNSLFGGSLSGAPTMDSSISANEESIGLSTGGAKDINNFRGNIQNGYFPLTTDIPYEGLFYDYYFDTGQKEECQDLFCPSYSLARSRDPFNQEQEYYMTVGLNSGIKESDFERKKLNLVVVLDISGSMGSSFDEYYYDPESDSEEESLSKVEVANQSVAAMTHHLNDDDRLGMVLFDDEAYLAKPLSKVKNTDMNAIREEILKVEEEGGTNMEAGYRQGTELFEEMPEDANDEYENRIIFLTDAMPNTGVTDKGSLLGMIDANSQNSIYSTIIGVGVDFNTELVSQITKTEGANYYSVHSAEDFSRRLDEEFEFMVTPLVFDLNLTFESESFEIDQIYGSPEADQSTGSLLKVNTLFPSSSAGGESKGGVVLLKLKRIAEGSEVQLEASYKDRQRESFEVIENIDLENLVEGQADFYENSGIRKAVLLTRYANIIKNWIYEERQEQLPEPILFDTDCLDCTQTYPIPPSFSKWERASTPLTVSPRTQEALREFKDYYQEEAQEIGDEDLQKEVKVLDLLIES